MLVPLSRGDTTFHSGLLSYHCRWRPVLLALLPAWASPQVINYQEVTASAMKSSQITCLVRVDHLHGQQNMETRGLSRCTFSGSVLVIVALETKYFCVLYKYFLLWHKDTGYNYLVDVGDTIAGDKADNDDMFPVDDEAQDVTDNRDNYNHNDSMT